MVVALNTSELDVPEGAVVAWTESMCRWALLSNKEQSSDVSADFPGSFGGEQIGMQAFFALPIVNATRSSARSAVPAVGQWSSSPMFSRAFGS